MEEIREAYRDFQQGKFGAPAVKKFKKTKWCAFIWFFSYKF